MKNNRLYIQIRSKKIGLLLTDARLSKNGSVFDISTQTGISENRLHDIEHGIFPPSLPELEILAFTYNLPIEHFWGRQILKLPIQSKDGENFQKLIHLRNKIIGANIQAKRQEHQISIEMLADCAEMEVDQLSKYESGEVEIPIPVLEIIAKCLNCQIEFFYDNQGKIGVWRKENAEIMSLRQLPQDFREFITKPINAPYLDLAMKLSELDVKKLRHVAEGLLEITL
jgi:transcriptional regulator with XRE-family HTH domain